jgi:hypothetical protein
MHKSPLILSDREHLLAPGREVPLALAGFPKEIEGKPCHYRRKEVVRAGEWWHRGDRKPFSVTREQLDAWVAAFNRRLSAGIRPFVPDHHTEEPKAGENFGYVVGLARDGDSLYADVQLVGDDALALAAKNDVSIYVKPEGIDAKGEPCNEFLHHLALTPDPNQPHLQPFVKIAASAAAGATATEVPIYELSAGNRSLPMFKPETLIALRKRLKLADDAPEADVAEQAAALALAEPPPDKGPEVVALSAKVKTLETERDAIKAEADTLRLSAASAPRQPDELMLAMYGENIAAKRESAIASGAVSEAEAKVFDSLIADANGRPTPLALSACGAAKRPLGFQLWDAVAKLAEGEGGKVRTGQKVTRAVGVAPGPNHQSLSLSAAGSQSDEDAAKDGKAQGEAYKNRQLESRGLVKAGT